MVLLLVRAMEMYKQLWGRDTYSFRIGSSICKELCSFSSSLERKKEEMAPKLCSRCFLLNDYQIMVVRSNKIGLETQRKDRKWFLDYFLIHMNYRICTYNMQTMIADPFPWKEADDSIVFCRGLSIHLAKMHERGEFISYSVFAWLHEKMWFNSS